MSTRPAAATVALLVLGTPAWAHAGTITAQGAVTAMTNTSQFLGIVGTGDFNEGPTSGNVPLNVYTPQGMTFRTGTLASILVGVTTPGTGFQPIYFTSPGLFPPPIQGGGTASGAACNFGSVVTFSTNITQAGVTTSSNATTYLTAWNKAGVMIGQVTWVPNGTAGFFGIDTQGVPVGMIAYGNDDLWNGATYDPGGPSAIEDSWIWAAGACANNAQCADTNPCTTDTCVLPAGLCAHTNNTAPCNDGNGCTQTDVCSNGSCSGTNPLTCVPLDVCHVSGTCDPATGVCSNPNKVDGTACSDGDACTLTDTCQSGACTGMNPTVCSALDGCHVAGTCDPATGICSAPTKPDGSACQDASACTQTDTCQSGVCSGMNPVMCPPPDQCHAAGTCDPTSGMCSNVALADGTACDDADACTQADTCQAGTCAGGPPISCVASDGCHDAGTCDPTTGTCSNPAKQDGATCDDGDACTQSDTCLAGGCAGSNAVVCMASDACHDAGTCDPATGMCSNPNKLDGAQCDDGDPCSEDDACLAGVCSGANPVTCVALDECHDVGTCDPSVGACASPAKPDGTACAGGTCTNGQCVATPTTSSTSSSSSTGAGGEGAGAEPQGGGCSCRIDGGSEDDVWAGVASGVGLLGGALVLARRRRRGA